MLGYNCTMYLILTSISYKLKNGLAKQGLNTGARVQLPSWSSAQTDGKRLRDYYRMHCALCRSKSKQSKGGSFTFPYKD